MKNLDLIGEELFNKIRGRFPSVTIGNGEGNVTNVPNEARFFDFDFKEGDKDLGKVSISVDDKSLSVMYSNNFIEGEDKLTKERWYGFLKELRYFAKKRLLNFDTRDITKSNLNRRDYKFLANKSGEETMSESKMYGTSRSSYQDVGTARLALKHSKPVNQEYAAGRTQNVEAIYIESSQGERFRYPFKHLNGARAMARHVSEGGNVYDDFGKHIVGLSEELAKLRKFKNYMSRSSVMAEGLTDYMDVVFERIDTVKKTVEQLQKESYYKEAFDNYATPVMEDVPEDVASNWIDQLTIKQFNEELKDVFPYIYKLVNEKTKAQELGPEDILGEDDVAESYMKGYQKYHCKDCGDTMHKPTTDCSHDPHDEKGNWWRDDNGNGVPDIMEDTDTMTEYEQWADEIIEAGLETEPEEEKIPVTEFVLSLFDRETGQFPKGETAVLTAIEKDYGEHYIDPAKSFIEAINEKYAQFAEAGAIQDQDMIEPEAQGTVMEPTVDQDEQFGEDMNAIMAKAGEDKHGTEYMNKAREKAQKKGAPLSSEEKDKLRDQHSKNRSDTKEDKELEDIRRIAGI
ncbi:MAG: hypothetical protein CMN33_02590 [Saprospirales bacterium]|nr:hypothetical protein [Saprospirales bacterium]|tara:strand:+ start:1024 stop:2736 length:1713 start_codon:yes stop_codon:yes gene_type:complete